MPEEDSQKASAKPKSGKMKIIVILVILLIVAGGGYFAFKMVISPKLSAPAEQTQEQAPVTQDAPAANTSRNLDPGVMVDFPSFIVNLSDPAGQRYLKVSLSVEVSAKDKKLSDEIALKMPKIKDTVITILSSKTFEEISTAQGKISLKQELLRRINNILTNGKARDVYITEFVIQ